MVYKVVLITHPSLNKCTYVFVGSSVPQHVTKILDSIKNTADVQALCQDDTTLLTDTFGPDWEMDFGFFEFNRFSALRSGDDCMSDKKCKSYLRSHARKIQSYRQVHSKATSTDRQLINACRRVWNMQLLKPFQKYKSQEITFVPFSVHPDDTVQHIKRKIYVSGIATRSLGFYLRPEWQYLFTHDRSLGIEFVETSDTRVVNPFSDIFSGEKHVSSNEEDTILDDYGVIDQNILYLVALPDVLKYANASTRLDDKTIRSAVLKYFPFAAKTLIFENRSDATMYAESTNGLKDMKEVVSAQEASAFLLHTESARALKVTQSVAACKMRVSSERKMTLDLTAIYQNVQPIGSIKFVALRGDRIIKDAQIRKYKLSRRDVHLESVKQWIDPGDDSKKPETCTFRFAKTYALNQANIALVLFSSGDYLILTDWQSSESGTVSLVLEIVKAIRSFLIHVINKFLSKSSQVTLPDLQFLNHGPSNVMVLGLDLAITLPGLGSTRYSSIQTLCECFTPYISRVTHESDINALFSKNPSRKRIISRLIESKLYDMGALSKLTAHGWSTLKLLTDTRLNQMAIDELRRFVNKTIRGFSFVFKKHSKFHTFQQIISDVAQFITTHHIEINQIFDDPYNVEMINRIRHRFNLSATEAQDFLETLATADVVEPSLSQSGIRCDLVTTATSQSVLRVKSLRQFSRSASLTFLITNLTNFFSTFFAIYKDRDVTAFADQHKCKGIAVKSSERVQSAADADDAILAQYFTEASYDYIDELSSDRVTQLDRKNRSKNLHADTQNRAMDESSDVISFNKGDYRMQQLQMRDPEIFGKWRNSKQNAAASCPKSRQPIVVSPDEYDGLDKTTFRLPSGTPDGFRYRDNYYLCPEVWCRSMRKSLRPEQLTDTQTATEITDKGFPVTKVISGKCPDGEAALMATAGVSGWKAKGINSLNALEGRFEVPGFLGKHTHPDKLGVPCCFQKDQSVGSSPKSAFLYQQINNESNTASDHDLSDSTRRNLLSSQKFPLPPERFGHLPEVLDQFFNGSVAQCSGKLYGQAPCYFRRGVDAASGASFLACVAHAFSEQSGKRFRDVKSFRNYIANNLSDDLLFSSLKNGNLKLIFEGRQPAFDTFLSYLRYSENIGSEYLWDLCSRPVEWLFPTGLNIFVFSLDTTKGDVFLTCPVGEVMSQFYDAQRKGIFLLTDGLTHEIITRVDSRLKTDCFFEPQASLKRVEQALHKCSTASMSRFTPRNLIETLSTMGDSRLFPRFQCVNAYNKVKYIITQSGVAFPTQPLGPWCDSSHPVPMTRRITPVNYQIFYSLQKTLRKVFKTALQPVKLVLDDHLQPAAIKTTNGLLFPIASSSKVDLEIDASVVFYQADDLMYKETVRPDERVAEIKMEQKLQISLDAFKRRIGKIMQSCFRNKLYYLRTVQILTGKDKQGREIPDWAKRSLLTNLFLKGSKDAPPLVRQCVTFSRDLSRPSRDLHIKLRMPEDVVVYLTQIIVHELVHNTFQRQRIMENDLQERDTLIRDSVSITDDVIEFDDTVVDYVLDLLQNPDPIKLNAANIVDLLPTDAIATELPVTTLKKHVLYDSWRKTNKQK